MNATWPLPTNISRSPSESKSKKSGLLLEPSIHSMEYQQDDSSFISVIDESPELLKYMISPVKCPTKISRSPSLSISQKSGADSPIPPAHGQKGCQPLISTGIESGSKIKLKSWARAIKGRVGTARKMNMLVLKLMTDGKVYQVILGNVFIRRGPTPG